MKKMSRLRTYYGRELGKEKTSRSSGWGGNEVYNSRWPFFNMLHFLRDNITPRKTQSTMQSVVNIDEESQLNTALDQEAEDLVDINPAVPASSNEVNGLYKVDNPPSTKSKRKKKLELEDELMASCLKEIKKPREDTSADELWAKYIGQQLTKVPEGYQKELLKLEIQQLIVKAIHSAPSRSTLLELDENTIL
jgi:hypothetical protein